jgi:hypothetical protein
MEEPLSQQPKRPGTRDISELKARLGLKKAGGAPAPAKGSGGVVAPPGVAVPPPPGVKPAGPVIPNAADDPFGAMNAMAHHGAMQRPAEIVIVHDGKPVEHVGASKRFVSIAKYAGIGLIPLVLGIVVGQISKEANIYNEGLHDAGLVLNDVKALKKGLNEVKSGLINAQAKGGGFDVEKVGAAVAAADKIDVKPELVFKAKQHSFDADLSSAVLKYYAEITSIKELIEDHIKLAKNDELALKAAIKASTDQVPDKAAPISGMTPYKSYGVLLSNPTEEEAKDQPPQGAYVVEIGPPVCGDKVSSSSSCSDAPVTGYTYRFSQTSPWMKGQLAVGLSSGDAFPAKKLVLLGQSNTMDALVKTPGGNATEELYQRRLYEINKKLEEVIKQGNTVETLLVKKSGESPRFSFFL